MSAPVDGPDDRADDRFGEHTGHAQDYQEHADDDLDTMDVDAGLDEQNPDGSADPGTATEDAEAGGDATEPDPSGRAAVRSRDRRRRRGDLIRAGIRGVGQTLVTLGLVVLLFVAYELWVTNIFAARKQSEAKHTLTQQWNDKQDPLKGQDKLKLPAGKQVVLPTGEGFANLYIPALGKDYAYTIVQGTDDASLEKGPGHYVDTAIPGQIGNFAVAGHRVGKGEPFLNLDRLKPADSVVVQTASRWYVYQVLGDVKTGNLDVADAQGVVGRQIVVPSEVGVIDPVPDHPSSTATRALMTMTTCTPKYSADSRMVVHAQLSRTVATSGSSVPRELGGTL